ncbi:MAG: DUF2807 domain-containing protein [Candidatus Omnitrophota bacterium]
MLNIKFIIMLGVSLILTGNGCDSGVVRGSNRVASLERDLEPFDKILIDRVYEVTLQQGGKPKMTITADDNINPLIVARVENNILRLDQLRGLQTKNPIKIKLVTPEIREITHASTANLYISIVDQKTLTVNNKTVGPILAKGTVGHLTLNVEGEGSTIFSGLTAKSAQVTSTGSARIDVFAGESIDVTNYGPGTITVYGKPKTVKEQNKGKGFIDIL